MTRLQRLLFVLAGLLLLSVPLSAQVTIGGSDVTTVSDDVSTVSPNVTTVSDDVSNDDYGWVQELYARTSIRPAFTCSLIPFPVFDESDLNTAITNANNETSCPGPDVIDLGGNPVTLTSALPQIISDVTIQNGTIERDGSAPGFRLLYNNNPGGILHLIDLFLSNGDDPLGAALYTVGGTVSIEGTAIWNNNGSYGAIRAFDNDSRIAISDSSFNFNDVDLQGGALTLSAGAQGYIVNSTFTGNSAIGGLGGAIHINNSTSLLMINVAMRDNSADNGGAIYSGGNMDLINVLISGNHAEQFGGGIYVFDDPSVSIDLELLNVTLAGNRAVDISGGGAIRMQGGDSDVDNSIIWGNLSGTSGGFSQDNVTVNTAAATIGFSRTILEGNLPLGATSDNTNYFTDPFFIDPVLPTSTNTPNNEGNYRIWEGSPAVDNGINTDAAGGRQVINVAEDLDRTPRIENGVVDLGAYEGPRSAANIELVTNGTFDSGAAQWFTFGSVTRSWTSGELRFYRNPGFTNGTLFHQMQQPLPSGASMEVTLQLGNTSGVDKHLEILLRNGSFSDYMRCGVTVPAGSGLQTVTLRGFTDEVWADSLLALTPYDRDGVSGIRLDNVSVIYDSTPVFSGYECNGLNAPSNTNLIKNGNFSQGRQYWTLFGDFDFQVTGGVMEFWRTAGATRSAIALQSEIGTNFETGSPIQMQFRLGNRSIFFRDVQVTMRDIDWAQFVRCTYTIAPNTPLTTVTMQAVTTGPWSRPLISFADLDGTGQEAIQLDDVTLQYRPSLSVGSTCGTTSISTAGDDPAVKPPITVLPVVVSTPPPVPEVPHSAPNEGSNPGEGGGMPTIPGF